MADNSATEISPQISIEAEMKKSYLDYAMSVIVSRAIPDVRDGLKPVHRRILFGMREIGTDWNKPYKKSARIVGDVMGKYHPHGDSAIYDALVRMAQPFSMRLPLVDGQGNFGSMDGDSPAAMRYTESRLEKVAHHLLEDLDKDTVNFQDNYDGNEKEPVVLPAEFPNLLVNGANGIAVGMATNIPPHNLGELLDACEALVKNPDLSALELMEYVPAPDFPTGGEILGRSGSLSALTTGRGSVVLRAKTDMETMDNGHTAIIVTEMPYQVNKVKLQERIAELVRDKKIEGISAMRDESDKQGVRLVIETRRDAVPEVVLNNLFRFTPLQTSFGVNMLALDHGKPRQMNLRDVLVSFLEFREEVMTRRAQYLLNKVRDRAHTLIGLAIAVANIDEVIKVIRASKDPVVAREELMRRDWEASAVSALIDLVQDRGNVIKDGRIKFTEAQARAILELRLQRLTGLEQEKINGELEELAVDIKHYLSLLGNRDEMLALMLQEFAALKEEFATPRRTSIEENEFEHDIEDLIEREDMVITVTQNGYVKRVPLDAFRAQRRGGKGRSAMSTRDEDMTTEVFMANTHTPVLFFSSNGKVYQLKTYKLPLGTPQSKGKALVNIFPLENGETIHSFMPLPEDEKAWDEMNIMFATSSGSVRRNDLSDFKNIRANGKIAIDLDEGESLVNVRVCVPDQHVLLSARSGKCIRFPVEAIRVFKSRKSTGVRGIKLADSDEVVSMSILDAGGYSREEREAYLKVAPWKLNQNPSHGEGSESSIPGEGEETEAHPHPNPDAQDSTSTSGRGILSEEKIAEMAQREQFILSITENGYGKRSSSYEYRTTNRGGSGITSIVTSERNGGVVAGWPIDADGQIMLMTDGGKLIRCPVQNIRIAGRNTQGVTIFKTAQDEKVVSAIRLNLTENDEDELDVDLEEAEGLKSDPPADTIINPSNEGDSK
jgi:DNA gyrase subunit A